MTLGDLPRRRAGEAVRIDPAAFACGRAAAALRRRGRREVGSGRTPTWPGAWSFEDLDGDGAARRADLDETTRRCGMRYYANDGFWASSRRAQRAAANRRGLPRRRNVVSADYDNDGDLDLLVLRGAWMRAHVRHPTRCCANDGHARVTDMTCGGLNKEPTTPSQTAACADIDNDGDLDLFVGNEEAPTRRRASCSATTATAPSPTSPARPGYATPLRQGRRLGGL